MPRPFMEHPTGNFDTARDAMEDAIQRLHTLPKWENWITFSAQGEGGRPDSYKIAEVRMLGDKLDVGSVSLDVLRIVHLASVEASSLILDGAYYFVGSASPRQVAAILDAIFRHHFSICPFQDESNDYTVGAEW